MTIIITQEDRETYRATLKQLDHLIETSEKILTGQITMTEEMQRVLYMLTKTSEHAHQLNAIRDMREMTHNDFRQALLYAAREDISAFHEYINPDEPPAKVHVILCETIHKVIRGEAPRLMVNMPPGHAKPLHVDTPVLMHDGHEKRLGDIEIGDFVITHEGRSREVIEVHEQGVLPALKITTESGRCVVAAPDHPFLTPRGYVDAGKLAPGTLLGFPASIAVQDTSGRSIDEFALAGYLLAFGFVTLKSFSRQQAVTDKFHAPNGDIHADVLDICQRLRFIARTARRVQYGKMVATISFGPDAMAWMEAQGLLTARTRDDLVIPEWIFRGDAARIGAFLGAIFTCDGAFRMERNRHTGRAREYRVKCATYRQARDLQRLLMRLGVNAVARQRYTTNHNYQPREFASLHVVTAADLYRMIGTLRFPAGVIPATFDDASVGFTGQRFISDKVLSVEPLADAPMRCLTVLDDHTFLADSLVVHNSTYCSVDTPAWWIGKNPRRKYLQAGHTQSFCEQQFGRRVKNLVASSAFAEVFPECSVNPDAANRYWITSTQTEYATLGVGQGISGFRAHLASVDDPFASVEDAENPNVRQKVWDWLTTDFLLRLMPECPLFIISTRWHLDDVCGRYLRLQKEQTVDYPFEQVILDAVCENPDFDPLNRKFGEPLWEDLFSRKFLNDKKTTLNLSRWQALYQQRPVSEEGALLNIGDIHYSDFMPGEVNAQGHVVIPCRRVVISVDTADKETKRSDYTSIGVWKEDFGKNYYLTRAVRKRLKFDELVKTIRKIANEEDATAVLIEDKGAGTQVISYYTTNTALAPNAPVLPVQPGNKSKSFRFDLCLPLFSAGRVRFPKRAPWTASYITELLEFPDGSHDDQVDMTSQALSYLARTAVVRGTSKLNRHGQVAGNDRKEQEAAIAEQVKKAAVTGSGQIAG